LRDDFSGLPLKVLCCDLPVERRAGVQILSCHVKMEINGRFRFSHGMAAAISMNDENGSRPEVVMVIQAKRRFPSGMTNKGCCA
jgi:hypothetical protein